MKKVLLPTSDYQTSKNTLSRGVSPFSRVKQGRLIPKDELAAALTKIQTNIDEGLLIEAEDLATTILETYSNSIDVQSKLNCLLSLSLEMRGQFEKSLEVLLPFEVERVVDQISLEPLTAFFIQLARAYINTGDYPRSIALLNSAEQIAEEKEFTYLLVSSYLAFSCVYKELNEYPISRNFADKAQKSAREIGDWRGLAEAYRQIAASHHREGNSEKSLEYFEQATKIIGGQYAPFLLGRIYSDLSATYSALRRPQEGIDCLKKAISLFEKIDQKYQITIAYNNLGVNLMLAGDWVKAEEILKHSLELAFETNHAYIDVIFDSLGELKLLRGDFAEAERLFGKAISSAERHKKEWYAVQVLCNLARCLLGQNKISAAIIKAKETMERSSRIGLHRFNSLASLILAECHLQQKNLHETEQILQSAEEKEHTSDFFVLGNIARIHGLLAIAQNDEVLAIHHFSRSLSIFEMAHDLYFTAFANFKLGQLLANKQSDKAVKHLKASIETFRKLDIADYITQAEELLKKIPATKAVKSNEMSVGSQLLMLRLAEAVASRELLFRELLAILQQDGNAKKTIIAERNAEKVFSPFVIDGFSSTESVELILKFHKAQERNDLENFSIEKNIAVFQLRAPSAPPALLIIYPRSGATLANNSPIQPLLRVVELGMDVCALREKDKEHQNETELSPFTSNSLLPGFIHSSPAMTELVDEVYKIRSSDVTVLITGESGTGKELVSRAVHAVSKRKEKVFVPFNCTAVPKELTEGHLFGYKKGSFTGAVTDSAGMIRSAHGGTLFLDEIGDLPLDVQPKILRFLQEGEVQPLGEKSPIKVDVRIITATNMNLEEKVAQGLFREDLYYRLNVIRLKIPPLRERRSEIPQMINYYMNHYSAKFGRKDLVITPQAMDLLIAFDWTGNVRQLCNEVQRIVARADNGEKITAKHLSADVKPAGTLDHSSPGIGKNVRAIGMMSSSINIQTQGGTMVEAVSALEIQMIVSAMRRHKGNVMQAAKELGLTRKGLYMKLARYELEETEVKKAKRFANL